MTKLGYYPVFFRPKNLIIRQTIDTPQLRVRTTRTQSLNRRHFEVPRCFVQRTIVGTSILCIDRRAPVKQQVEFVDSASGHLLNNNMFLTIGRNTAFHGPSP